MPGRAGGTGVPGVLLPQYLEDTLNNKSMYSNEGGHITVLYPQLSTGPAWGGSDELPPETFGRKFPSIGGRQSKYVFT